MIDNKGLRSIAYFFTPSAERQEMTLDSIDGSLLTHVNIAFANLREDGEVIIGHEDIDLHKSFILDGKEYRGYLGQIKYLKDKYQHLKFLISIGGWTWSRNFSDVAADPDKRRRFVTSSINFILKFDMDGIDIDWEYPVSGGDNINHREEDGENYTLLLSEIREELNKLTLTTNKTYLLSIAARAASRFVADANLLESSKYLDFINIMTYDYHGYWENKVGFNSPLNDKENNEKSIVNSIDSFLEAGIEPQKINLGLAFYGRGWIKVSSENNGINQFGSTSEVPGYGLGTHQAGSFELWDIKENYLDKSGYVRYFDEDAQSPYIYNGDIWICYEDEESILIKTEYAMKMNLGGVMFWEFTGDRDLSLQKAIAKAIKLI